MKNDNKEIILKISLKELKMLSHELTNLLILEGRETFSEEFLNLISKIENKEEKEK